MAYDNHSDLHRAHAYSSSGYHRIQIPSSTPESLVFPYDITAKKFNTTNYFSVQTQERATVDEIEDFLSKVSEPILDYYKKYDPQTLPAKFLCLGLICMILIPLFPFFMCYMCHKSNEMVREMKKVSEKAAIIVRSNSASFTEKGLIWNIPTYFPHWIELWTTGGVAGGIYGQQVQPFVSYTQPPGIQMRTVPQQNYQSTYVNQV